MKTITPLRELVDQGSFGPAYGVRVHTDAWIDQTIRIDSRVVEDAVSLDCLRAIFQSGLTGGAITAVPNPKGGYTIARDNFIQFYNFVPTGTDNPIPDEAEVFHDSGYRWRGYAWEK